MLTVQHVYYSFQSIICSSCFDPLHKLHPIIIDINGIAERVSRIEDREYKSSWTNSHCMQKFTITIIAIFQDCRKCFNALLRYKTLTIHNSHRLQPN